MATSSVTLAAVPFCLESGSSHYISVCYGCIIVPTEGAGTTGLFISPSGISELDCATTKTDTAERSISIGRESLQFFFFCTRGLGVLPGSTARGVFAKKNGVHSE